MVRTIVCFGDSNTHGYDAETKGRFSPDVRWPGRLRKILGEEYQICEEGLSGRTAVFRDPLFEGLCGFDYLYPCLMTHEPVDLLIVMLGTNDVKSRFSAGPENIAKGIRRLLIKAIDSREAWREQSPEILLVCPPPIGKEYENTQVYGEMGEGCAEKASALAGLYRGVAEELSLHFLDASGLQGMKMSSPDYMHLDGEGHRILADGIADKIKDIFK